MDDFVASPSRWRIALIILGAVAFVGVGLWEGGAFGSVPQTSGHSPAVTFAVGWSCAVFFGLCGAMGARRFFDRGEQLRIGSAGVRSARWSDQTIPWSEIIDVTTWRYRSQRAIILHLHDPARFPGRGLPALLAGANRKLTGGDVSISLTGTDRTFDEAISAIARFRPTTSLA
jgi:hypothetical protein